MKIKTSELIGAQLDWAVAKASGAEGLRVTDNGSVCCAYKLQCGSGCWTGYYEPSTDWSQGGPLIDRFGIDIIRKTWCEEECDAWVCVVEWSGAEATNIGVSGPTFLIALCRAIVAAKLGEEIEVPEELV